MKKNKELLDVVDPFARAYRITAMHNNISSEKPLRELLPGIWPTLQDLENLYKFAIKNGWNNTYTKSNK